MSMCQFWHMIGLFCRKIIHIEMSQSRRNIPLASVGRIMRTSIGSYHTWDSVLRVSKKAIERMAMLTEWYLEAIGTAASEILAKEKKKTVELEDVLDIISNRMPDLGVEADKLSTVREGRSIIPTAGISREFRSHLPPKTRVSKEALDTIVNATEAFVAYMSKRASLLADHVHRHTLKVTDLDYIVDMIPGARGRDQSYNPFLLPSTPTTKARSEARKRPKSRSKARSRSRASR